MAAGACRRRTRLLALVAALLAALTASCGHASPEHVQPTAGPLTTFPDVDALTHAVDPGCAWQVSRGEDETAETEASCEATGLWLQWIPGEHVLTVAEARDMFGATSPELASELCEHYHGGPFIVGGNWWGVARDDAQASDVGARTQAYVVGSIDCPS